MDFKTARYAARMTPQQVAEYLELSPRTIARYEMTGKAPKAVIECLLLLGGKMPSIGRRNCFDGWSFGNGYLWSPAGERFTSGDVLSLRINQQLVESLHRSNVRMRKSEEQEKARLPSNVIPFPLKRGVTQRA